MAVVPCTATAVGDERERCFRQVCVALRTTPDACVRALPTCAAGTTPAFNGTSCCGATCKPAPIPAACSTRDADDRCRAMYLNSSATRLCASGEKPALNRDTCCPTCRPPPPSNFQRPVGEPCTASRMSECLSQVDDCADGETPKFDAAACCGSCRRPQRGCKPSEVAACVAALSVCEAGDTPQQVAGRCCPSCRPAPPACTPPCSNSSVCVRTGSATTGTCRSKRSVAFRLTGLAQAARDAFGNGTASEVVREIVRRWCDQAEMAATCAAIADGIESLAADFAAAPGDGSAGTLTVNYRSGTARQDAMGTAVTGGVTSSDASGGQFSATTAAGAPSSAASAAVSVVAALLAAVVVAVAAL